MDIDQDRVITDISDHSLVRTWFRIRREERKWRKLEYKMIEWYKKNINSLTKMEKCLESMIRQRSGFNRTMNMIKISQEKIPKRKRGLE